MKEYGKIRTDGSIQKQGNPVIVNIANPTEEQKEMCAALRSELELVYTEIPEYDEGTQYVTEHWEEQDGKAVQCWEVHDIPIIEVENDETQNDGK